jgi:hypothetical protein
METIYDPGTPSVNLEQKRAGLLAKMSADVFVLPSTFPTIPDPLHHELIVQNYGASLQFATRVEHEARTLNVPQIDALIDGGLTENEAEFLAVWDDQENGHYETLRSILLGVGLDEAPADFSVHPKLRILGAFARWIPGNQLPRIIKYTYFCMGAINEAATDTNYLRLSNGFKQLGEPEIAATIHKIRRQEPLHQAFYKESATLASRQMALWERRLVAATQSGHFAMVGAKNKLHKAQLGATITQIAKGSTETDAKRAVFDADLAYMSRRVFRTAKQVLYEHDREGLQMPNFVLAALAECVDLYRKAKANGEFTDNGLWIPPAQRNVA